MNNSAFYNHIERDCPNRQLDATEAQREAR